MLRSDFIHPLSDLRLRRRPISKKLEKVPDYCRKVERGVRSQKIFLETNDVRSQKNEGGDVRSQKKVKPPPKNSGNSGPTPVARG